MRLGSLPACEARHFSRLRDRAGIFQPGGHPWHWRGAFFGVGEFSLSGGGTHWRDQRGLCGVVDLPGLLRASLEAQNRGPGFYAVGGNRDDGDFVNTIWKDEMVAKRTIGSEGDGFSVNGDFCARIGASVEDDLGVDVHEEIPCYTERTDPF